MSHIATQHVAAPTKRAQIAHLIPCQFAAANVVDVAAIQGDENATVDTFTTVAFPDLASRLAPDVTRLS